MRRAVELAPELPLWSLNYATLLLNAGQRERARSLAGRLSSGGAQQRASAEAITAMIEASEARFRAASARASAALAELNTFGLIEMADGRLLGTTLTAARLLGSVSDVADAFAERFVLADPLAPRHGPLRAAVRGGCMRGSVSSDRPALLREAEGAGSRWMVSRGAHCYDGCALGRSRAIRSWRLRGCGCSVAHAGRRGNALPDYVSVGLEKAGEPELASENDKRLLAHRSAFNGATMAHVREAHRAAKRRDFDQARLLAKAVIGAWSVADAKVPAVDEMRKLLDLMPK